MKRRAVAAVVFMGLFAVSCSFCEEKETDPNQSFYKANIFYEKREYQKAIDEYLRVLDMGLENGRLYYNIGNAYFKIGRLGQAILYYEKARRLIPQDGDLRSNLDYAKSLVGEVMPQAGIRKTALQIAMRPFRDFNLNALSIASAVNFIVFVILVTLFLVNPFIRKKFIIPLTLVTILLVLSLATFGIRYYQEEALAGGVIIRKNVDCRYEPIDQSTVYYTLPEGSPVTILETRDGWSRVKRFDGKIGWLKKDAAAEV